jgi:hypothetical protein
MMMNLKHIYCIYIYYIYNCEHDVSAHVMWWWLHILTIW